MIADKPWKLARKEMSSYDDDKLRHQLERTAAAVSPGGAGYWARFCVQAIDPSF
jgi:hypothetical protein